MQHRLLPQFLQVELTYACNSACTFCYNPNHHREFDEQRCIKILDEVDRYQLAHVQLIGGEITVLPQLPDYLARLRRTRWKSIVTNGRIFVPALDGLVDEIYLSLHGDSEVHEQITNATGSFEVITDSIQRYVAFGIEVHSDTVLTSQNYDQIGEVAKYAKELGMAVLFVNIFQPVGIGAAATASLAPSVDQIRSAIDQMLKARDELGLDVRFGTSTPYCLDERLVTEELAFTCGTGTWFGSVSPDGELRICNQSSRSYGNVLEEPLGKIWNSLAIDQDYRDLSWLDEPCCSCPIQNECLGGCRISGSGEPRIDPIVMREKANLLSLEQLTGLKEQLSARSALT